MIIFGWGRKTVKNFGPTFKNYCTNCNNEDYWFLIRVITWFSLFFIPMIPYSIKYSLRCTVCQHGLSLTTTQVQQIKPLAEVNQLLIEGKITEKEHVEKISQFSSDKMTQTEAEQDKSKTLPNNNRKQAFCSQCGARVARGEKFCSGCGANIAKK